MNIGLLIPVKSLDSGKSRLLSICDGPLRRKLNEWFVRHTLTTARLVPTISRIAVISPCDDVLVFARSLGAHTIFQLSNQGLNGAVDEGLHALRGLGAENVLIMPIDEPFLQPSDILDVLDYGERHRSVVICPDKHRAGTNAIFVPAGVTIKFHFGENSCQKHAKASELAGVISHIYFNARIAFDIDTPSDLRRWLTTHRSAGISSNRDDNLDSMQFNVSRLRNICEGSELQGSRFG